MVTPAWPPTTGTARRSGRRPAASATNALARSTSSLVTPSSLRGSYVPALHAIHQSADQTQSVGLQKCACRT